MLSWLITMRDNTSRSTLAVYTREYAPTDEPARGARWSRLHAVGTIVRDTQCMKQLFHQSTS